MWSSGEASKRIDSAVMAVTAGMLVVLPKLLGLGLSLVPFVVMLSHLLDVAFVLRSFARRKGRPGAQ